MHWPRLTRPPIRVLWLIAAWPVIVGIWSVVVHRNAADAIGDGALLGIDLESLTDHPLLTGAYSRFWFHHPGPMYQYALAPLYWIFPGAWSPHVMSGILNLIWIAIALWAAGRIMNARLRFPIAVGIVVLIASMPAVATMQSWNASAGLLAAAAYLVVLWSHLNAPSGRTLFAATLIGSFVLQTHLSWAPIILPATLVVLAIRGFKNWSARWLAPLPVAGYLGVTVLCWAAPLFEWFANDPNNVDEILNRSDTLPQPHGFGTSMQMALGQLARPVGFVFGLGIDRQGGTPGAMPKLLTIGLIMLAAYVAWNARDHSLGIGIVLLLATWCGTVISFTRMTDNPVPRYLGHMGGAAMSLLVVIVAITALRKLLPALSAVVVPVSLVMVLATTFSTSGDLADQSGAVESHPHIRNIGNLIPEGAILGLGDIAAWEPVAGVVLQQCRERSCLPVTRNAEAVGTPQADTARIVFRPWSLTKRRPTHLLRTNSEPGANEVVLATEGGITLTEVTQRQGK